ncbi:PatA/PatG family cyanobactin maturation protease [Dickeya zeae]|jgi:cyanobactin maturation PatA/PatG family protease|uniref:PatA/PatG family cyanobactin maturation protease n=1 Tax=Dickeya zeae TaxID=204042 RepID=UPI00037C3341|nr:PatA/PatG family cyanobactin maturation protease [Dickeya zeae]MCA6987595.1 PatA/PatG family cyanobactin maturation protease [Dickeya zeae]UJR56046.1 PatA/PatG family cyanobactin maturation protease [Dickeya zeae MS1]UJR64075.1 PatA/PatG family cyanobactin maturation protease [Dickeya zeae]
MMMHSSNTRDVFVDNPLSGLQQLGINGEGVKIGIIDGAIDSHHPILNHLTIESLAAQENKTTSHGTAVSSIIGGKGVGIAPAATILSIPVFHEDERGNIHGCSERTLAKAIRDARLHGCHIINVSGASLSINGQGTDELRKAIDDCEKDGVLIVAAVGNEGRNSESLPASMDFVLAVGACDKEGLPAPFNNYGLKLRKKMLLASGVSIPVATPNYDLSVVSGSSFSAPVVSAISALIMRAINVAGHCRAPQIIRDLLFTTATPLVLSTAANRESVIYRLNIQKVFRQIAQEFSHQPPKRIMTMSTEEKNIEPAAVELLVPSIIDTHQDIQDVALGDDAVLAPSSLSTEVSAPSRDAGLAFPKISDPAANHYVHAPARRIMPQSSALDARTVRDQEKIFVIGQVGYDFGTEARLDYFTQVMGNKSGYPFDPVQMAEHLNTGDNAEQSNALIWTLKIDGIPVYAIKPDAQFAVLEYARLVEFLYEQETKGVERVSIAGIISGETRLFNGQVIPTISPVLRGMFNWESQDISKMLMGESAVGTPKSKELINFINRIYYELRNRGYESNERAINYAATNAYQMKEIFDDAFAEGLFLNKISAERSPVSRPESDCWDVVLEFFNPKERLTAARKLYRYTIDVSDVMPVTIGTLRSWHAY